MRRLARPVMVFALLCAFTYSQSRAAAPPINTLVWTKGFPKALVGGVDVSVDLGPAAGWSCTNVTMLVVDDATGKAVDDYDQDDPPGLVVAHTFTGIKRSLKVRVSVDATFSDGNNFDVKQIQTYVTTK
jgi:hypothetical protein